MSAAESVMIAKVLLQHDAEKWWIIENILVIHRIPLGHGTSEWIDTWWQQVALMQVQHLFELRDSLSMTIDKNLHVLPIIIMTLGMHWVTYSWIMSFQSLFDS